MAIPDQVQVPSGTHTQRFIPSGFVSNSISILNPNNGVCFVARNRDCISTMTGAWDWKVPSQSYAYLPGPFQSVGLYYQDQSGAATPGDISTYASEQKFDLPHFQAIGLTLASVVTTLDIGQGSKPSNPAANNIRLWADGSGNLHILAANGTDKVVIDSSNIGSQTIAGDVIGTLSTTHIAVRYNSSIDMLDGSGVQRQAIRVAPSGGNQLQFFSPAAGSYQWFTQGGAAQLMSLDMTGNVVLSVGSLQTVGTLSAGGAPISTANGDISAQRNATQGYLFLGSNGQHYVGFDGGTYQFPNGSMQVAGNLLLNTGRITLGDNATSGYIYFGTGQGHYLGYDGANWTFAGVGGVYVNSIYASGSFINSSGGYVLQGYNSANYSVFWRSSDGLMQFATYNGTFQFYDSYTGSYSILKPTGGYLALSGSSASISLNATGAQIAWPNSSYISGNAGYVQGSSAALKHSLSVLPDTTLLDAVSDPRLPVSTYLFPDDERRNFGFLADDIALVLPDLVFRDTNGMPAGYVPGELTAILWGAVRALKVRVDDLTSRLPA